MSTPHRDNTEAAEDADERDIDFTEEQTDALELSHNIAVTAGAGTGKTTTLTQRYLKMLEEESVTPEDIVTITFTKDAANEMRERIRAAVDERLTEASDQDEFDRWRAIRDELEDGYIHTIHAFCSRILREHAVEAPVTPDFDVLDETNAAALQRDLVTEFVDDRQDEYDLQLLARLWSRSELETVLVGLLDSRPNSTEWASYWKDASPDEYLDVAWERFVPIDGDQVELWFDDAAFVDALQTLRDLHARDLDIGESDSALAKIRQIDDVLAQTGALSEDASTRDRQTAINDIANVLTTNKGKLYGNDYEYYGAKSNGWPSYEEEQYELTQAMDTLLDTIEPDILPTIEDLSTERNSSYYVLALARLYDEVEATYTEAKADQGAVDFSDLIETTIEFLHGHDEVRTAIQSKFEYIMVDEVQDTDSRQWRLVQALTGTDPTQFDSRNVFLVGDEKQSIYRFRGADVTAFGEARGRLDAANGPDTSADLPLSGNFRTVESTLEFMNDLFQEVFQPEGESYEPYEARPQRLDARRQRGMDIDGDCEYLLIPESGGTGLLSPSHPLEDTQFINTAHREGTALAARLTHLFADPPEVYDEEEHEYRSARPDDVTILLRARTRLEFYERALEEVDIPYTVVSGEGFYDTPEITALVNLLRVLENPSDDIPLYGVLRSPLFGFTDERIARSLVTREADSLWNALSTADGELADTYELLTTWRKEAGLDNGTASTVTSWSSLLTQVIHDTGYLASVSADDRPQQAVVNVEKLREKFRSWEEKRVFTITGLLDRIDQHRELGKKTPEATIHTESDGVEIRTVHSAKGLESRIIVVPELNVGFNQRANVDEYGKVYLDETDGVPFLGLKAPTESDTFAQENTLVRARLQEQYQREDRAEQKRLLYVALTRARDHLILSGTNKLAVSGDNVFPKGADPEDASSWRDFVEPVLFDGVELGQLLNSDSITGILPNSEYSIRLPPEPVEWGQIESRAPESPPTIETTTPERSPQPTRLSATDYAKTVGGYEDDESYDRGEPERSGDREEADSNSDTGELAAAFGDTVHRICELDRPQAEWTSIIEQMFDEHDVPVDDADVDAISMHAQRGLSAVKSLHESLTDPLVYKELFVRATLDSGQIIGFIDHLVVTDDAYYVLDFKTSDTSERAPADIAKRYWPQLKAYAVALAQQDPRDVYAQLYFTDADSEEERLQKKQITPDDISGIEADLERVLQDKASKH